MATMNFSIPDDVRDAFDEAFKNDNKSAIVAELMRREIDRVNLQRDLAEKSRTFLERVRRRIADSSRVYTDDEIRKIRQEMRD